MVSYVRIEINMAPVNPAQFLADILTFSVDVTRKTQLQTLEPKIQGMILAEARNINITDLSDPDTLAANIQHRVSSHLEELKAAKKLPELNSLTKSHVNTFISAQSTMAVNAKIQDLTASPTESAIQILTNNNNRLINKIIDGDISAMDAMINVHEAFEGAKKFIPEPKHQAVLDSLSMDIATSFLSEIPDPITQSVSLNEIRAFLPPAGFQKLAQKLKEQSDNPSLLDNEKLGVAYEKLISGKELSSIERRYITVSMGQVVLDQITHATPDVIRQLLTEKGKTIQSIANKYYIGDIKNAKNKNDPAFLKRNEFNREILGGNWAAGIQLLLSKSSVPKEQKALLRQQYMEVVPLQERKMFLDQGVAEDSAALYSNQGFTRSVTFNFSDPREISNSFIALDKNYQFANDHGIATTFFDKKNMEIFVHGLTELYDPVRRGVIFEIAKETVSRDAYATIIKQLSSIAPNYAAGAELLSLFNGNFFQQIDDDKEKVPVESASDDSMQILLRGAYVNPEVGDTVAQVYRNADKDSPLKRKIDENFIRRGGGFLSPDVSITINAADRPAYLKKTNSIELVRSMDMNELKECTYGKSELYINGQPLGRDQISYITLQNGAGGTAVAYYKSPFSFSGSTQLTYKNGTPAILDLDRVSKIGVHSYNRRKALERENFKNFTVK